MEQSNDKEYYEGENYIDSEDGEIKEYDITSAPNDFNIKTLFDFIESGIVNIPGFQRNYVWDIKKASKLIESIIIGIPIPQIFLFEEAKNKFLVIDGQQRYMTIYYFKKQRFPKKEKRIELRRIFDESKKIPDKILYDNNYFTDFDLQLPCQHPEHHNRLNRLNYSTLEEDDRICFDLRTIRNVIIKQNAPDDGNSVIFEIFNRLNSGGVNLKPQEIRTSIYHSDFYNMLYDINLNENWRKLTPSVIPDLHMRDIEILLRAFAMLTEYKGYNPSMTKFLNKFSEDAKKFNINKINHLKNIFEAFINKAEIFEDNIFFGKNKRFNISIFEAIFVACCNESYSNNNLKLKALDIDKINILKENQEFIDATQSDTASKKNVIFRINKAKEIFYNDNN